MLVSKISQKKVPRTSTVRSTAETKEAQAMVEEVREYLKRTVPDANPTEDFLVKVASTYGLSNKNPSVLDAAVKKLQK